MSHHVSPVSLDDLIGIIPENEDRFFYSFVPSGFKIDNAGTLYLTDGNYSFTAVLTFDLETDEVARSRFIAQDENCFSYAPTEEGYLLTLGGKSCLHGAGGSLLHGGALLQAVGPRITRTPL